MSRRQFTGQYVFAKVGDVVANAADDGTANSGSFDTNLCNAPSFNVDIVDLDAGKKLAIKMQHSDAAAADFTDVPAGIQTNANEANEIDADGVQKYFYGGVKRYIRLVVISKAAAPGATVRVYSRQDMLAHVPDNTGI